MTFYTTVLGSGAAVPTLGRHCSAQCVNINGCRILLDCGEGTQNQLRAYHQKMQGINIICLTHLHGDHFFGLPGFLTTQHLCGRTEAVDIVAPLGVKAAMDPLLELSGSHVDYEVRYTELSGEGLQQVYDNNKCRIYAFPLLHSVPTYGYLIEEKPRGKNPARRYAYCCDTGYTETFLPYIQGVDLLCMDCTFANDFTTVANEKLHCTAAQAATIAAKAGAHQLLLTHFSARYKTLDLLLQQACEVFPNSLLASDGLPVEIHYKTI